MTERDVEVTYEATEVETVAICDECGLACEEPAEDEDADWVAFEPDREDVPDIHLHLWCLEEWAVDVDGVSPRGRTFREASSVEAAKVTDADEPVLFAFDAVDVGLVTMAFAIALVAAMYPTSLFSIFGAIIASILIISSVNSGRNRAQLTFEEMTK